MKNYYIVSWIYSDREVRWLFFSNQLDQSGYGLEVSPCTTSLISVYERPIQGSWEKVSHYCLNWWVVISILLLLYAPNSGFISGLIGIKRSKKETYFVSLKTLFKDYVISEPMISLGNSFELLVLAKRLGWRLLYLCFSKSVKSHKRLCQLNNFFKYLLQMRKHHGDVFVVNYLKAGQLAIQKQLAKDKIESLRDLNPKYPFPRLSQSGLPRIIPLMDRRLICQGSGSVIRWWLSLFSVYRVISIPGQINLSTITNPLTVPIENVEGIADELDTVVSSYSSIFSKFSLGRSEVSFLETASPRERVSWVGLFHDLSFLESLNLVESVRYFLKCSGSFKTEELFKHLLYLREKYPNINHSRHSLLSGLGKDPVPGLGQISFKKEAAGKMRGFALVDIWTQTALKPLHLYLFDFLKSLPNDGTFDQYASVKRCFSKVAISGKSFGYDLTAATDRLPILLQRQVLTSLFNKELSDHWFNLLVNRDYYIKIEKGEKYPEETLSYEGSFSSNKVVRYAVGQPMGALSSWAMLAITHHLIVQLAARNVLGVPQYGKWFTNYELLGDDIVIFDEPVAMEYLSIMKTIGVPINLSKSVVSSTQCFEFAKITGYKGKDVSALSWRMLISQNTLMGRANIAYSLSKKGLFLASPIRTLRMLMSKSRFSMGALNYPYMALLSMYTNSNKFSVKDLLTLILNTGDGLSYNKLLKKVSIPYLELILAKLINSEVFDRTLQTTFSTLMYWKGEPSIRAYLNKIINKFWYDDPWKSKTEGMARSMSELLLDVDDLDENERMRLVNLLCDITYYKFENLQYKMHNLFLGTLPHLKPKRRQRTVSWQEIFYLHDDGHRLVSDEVPSLKTVKHLDNPLDELMEVVTSIDSIQSAWKLPERAMIKLTPSTKEVILKKEKENPLKLVKLVLAALLEKRVSNAKLPKALMW